MELFEPMDQHEIITVEEGGEVILPSAWRKKMGLSGGGFIIMRRTDGGIMIEKSPLQIVDGADD